MVAEGKLQLKGEIEAASKAEKLEWKPQEEQIDAFGNVVKIKVIGLLSACCHVASAVPQLQAFSLLYSGIWSVHIRSALWCSFWASNCSISFEQRIRHHSKGMCADSLSQTQAPKKKLSNKEKKQRAKVRKAQRERGEDVSDTDEDEL